MGRSVDLLVGGWLLACLVGGWGGPLIGGLVHWLVGLVGGSVDWLVGWLVHCLLAWWVGGVIH